MYTEPTINLKQENQNQGFTLIELTITMVLVAILMGVSAGFISTTMEAYTANTNRARLTDAAELALRRMARDLQAALPNSARVKAGAGSIMALEMVNVVEGVRYRAQGTTAGTYLDFNTADTDFDIIGKFQTASLGSHGYRLVIYNTGALIAGNFDSPVDGVNVYSTATSSGTIVPPTGTAVVTPASTVVTLSAGTNDHVNLSPGMQFAFQSPVQRMYVIDTPVTYLCSPAATNGSITRYSGYSIGPVQPASAAALAAATSVAQLTGNVTACSFTYTQGSTQRNAVITMSLTLTQSGESVTLMRQVNVDNIP